MSAIPVMTTPGIEDVYTTTGTVNGEKFVEFFLSVCATNYYAI